MMLMFTISIAQISKFQRAQLNEVGLKEPCCRLGAQPLNTIHIYDLEAAQHHSQID